MENEKTAMGSTGIGMKIKVCKNGPYIVTGGVPLTEEAILPVGGHEEYRESRKFECGPSYSLCRCGHTKTPPFCDGSHANAHFNGTETASKEPFADRAESLIGQSIDLLDDGRCAFARFCHREDGSVWELTVDSDDPHLRDEAIKASSDCPAGRLVHYDKEGNEIEPQFEPGIAVLQDVSRGVGCALFVRGGIPLEGGDGELYELRNRYALCRCGGSSNKPFCDASHMRVDFQAR